MRSKMSSQTDCHKVLIIQGGKHEIQQRDLSDGTKEINVIGDRANWSYLSSDRILKEDEEHKVASVAILSKIYNLIKQTQ